MNKAKVAYTASVLNKVDGKQLNGEVQSQNFKTGRVYVFGKDNTQCLDDSDDDTVFEMVKVRPRKAKNGHKDEEEVKNETQKVDIIHRAVFPNDTLSKFALQYGCTVAELKTTNNLYNEQDFHALKHIKIPIQKHSLLTERAEEERRRENAFGSHDAPIRTRDPSQGTNSDSDYENIDENNSPNVRTVSISANLKDTEKFLKRMDDDIQKICKSVSNREPNADDVNRKLTTQCIHPRISAKKDAEELGMIWSGFGWKSAVLAFIFIAIVLPLFYFIYIEKFKSQN